MLFILSRKILIPVHFLKMSLVLLLAVFQLGVSDAQSLLVSSNFTRVKYPEPVKILQDDIILPAKYDEKERLKLIETDIPTKWPGGIVHYIFEASEVDQYHQSLIRSALRNIEAVSCVRFIEGRTSSGSYLRVRNTGQGCASAIGYQTDEQMTDLYLSGDLCYTQGSIQHEFLHALGFGHEHTRPDRDSYVTVNWSNIVPGAEINFTKRRVRWVTDLLPYDYQSVMHYRADAFKRDNSSLTVVPRQPGAIQIVGQRYQLSGLDINKLNLLYNCYGQAPPPPPHPPPPPPTPSPSASTPAQEILEKPSSAQNVITPYQYAYYFSPFLLKSLPKVPKFSIIA